MDICFFLGQLEQVSLISSVTTRENSAFTKTFDLTWLGQVHSDKLPISRSTDLGQQNPFTGAFTLTFYWIIGESFMYSRGQEPWGHIRMLPATPAIPRIIRRNAAGYFKRNGRNRWKGRAVNMRVGWGDTLTFLSYSALFSLQTF